MRSSPLRRAALYGRRVRGGRAAAWIAGANRWPEAKWRDLEMQVGTSRADDEMADNASAGSEGSIAGMVRRAPLRRGRRVFRSSYMS